MIFAYIFCLCRLSTRLRPQAKPSGSAEHKVFPAVCYRLGALPRGILPQVGLKMVDR